MILKLIQIVVRPPSHILSRTMSDKNLSVCTLCSLALARIAAWGAGVTWSVFAIKALASSSNHAIQSYCAASHLYPACIVAVVITIGGLISHGRSSGNGEDGVAAAACAMVVSLSLYGWIIAEYHRCRGLPQANPIEHIVGIWVWSIGGTLAICALAAVVFAIGSCLCARCRKNKNPSLSRKLRDDDDRQAAGSVYTGLEEGRRPSPRTDLVHAGGRGIAC